MENLKVSDSLVYNLCRQRVKKGMADIESSEDRNLIRPVVVKTIGAVFIKYL